MRTTSITSEFERHPFRPPSAIPAASRTRHKRKRWPREPPTVSREQILGPNSPFWAPSHANSSIMFRPTSSVASTPVGPGASSRQSTSRHLWHTVRDAYKTTVLTSIMQHSTNFAQHYLGILSAKDLSHIKIYHVDGHPIRSYAAGSHVTGDHRFGYTQVKLVLECVQAGLPISR